MFRYEPAIIDSHFNFVGYASTLVKKGANESFAVTKYFRDISIEPIETIKEEDQVDIDLGESSKCMYFDSLAPINLGFLCRTILTVPGEIQLISVTEAVKVTIAAKEAPVEVLEEDVDGLQPPQVHSVARPDEDDGKDALVGKEVEREAPATGAIVTVYDSRACMCAQIFMKFKA